MLPVGAFIIFWAAFMKRAYKDVPLMKSQAFPFQVAPKPFAYVTAFFIVLAIAVLWGRRSNSSLRGGGGGGGAPPSGATAKGQPYEPHFQWLPLAVLGSIVIGIGGSMFLLTQRRKREEDDPDAMRVTVAEVLEETLDDLIREPDPRKAVIAAYAKDGAHARRARLTAGRARGARRVPGAHPRRASAPAGTRCGGSRSSSSAPASASTRSTRR